MAQYIIIARRAGPTMDRRNFEMCEHKGIGHPDTLTDAMCEAASRALSRAYLDAYGCIQHHNLDKGLLLAGRSIPRFGGGTIRQPMRVWICGRATLLNESGMAERLAVDAARFSLKQSIRYDTPCEISAEIGEGSSNLTRVFGLNGAAPIANDTSFGAGFAPLSKLEGAVLSIAQALREPAFRQTFPAVGDDFKIMGYRHHGHQSFVVAQAFVDHYVDSVAHYFTIKQAVLDYLEDGLNLKGRIRINTLDDPHAVDEHGVYLTVTGLSAEMGDDGQVGRGNRVNGLITPGRPMSLEAVAGKNPATHVGKLYNVLAFLMARDIYEQIDEVDEAFVYLLSAIGAPINQPQLVGIDIINKRSLSATHRTLAESIVTNWLADLPKVTELLLSEQISFY